MYNEDMYYYRHNPYNPYNSQYMNYNVYNPNLYTAYYQPYTQNIPNDASRVEIPTENINEFQNQKQENKETSINSSDIAAILEKLKQETFNETQKETKQQEEQFQKENMDEQEIDEETEQSKKGFRLGPLEINNERISIFGFSIALDDIILVVLIIFLFFQSDCDYTLLIVLGLMLFNISFSSLNLF